ncbi:MAG TPA: cytochrome P460 family protein [Pirellulales bacterium]|nr:cytochrome P460 family protein [Pirellulales bacterium]
MRVAVFFGAALLGATGVWGVLQSSALSQGSGSSRLTPPRRQPARAQTPAEFQQSFWRFITRTSPYRDWATWPQGEEQPREGADPHGPWVKTYANATAAGDPKTLRYGSILINEEYDADKETLTAISVMYCVKGTDPAHYDWYWIKYSPDGSVAKAPAQEGGKPLAGKVQSCIACHQKAKRDLVFSNDLDTGVGERDEEREPREER